MAACFYFRFFKSKKENIDNSGNLLAENLNIFVIII